MRWLISCIVLIGGLQTGAPAADLYRAEREALIRTIEQDVVETSKALGRDRLRPEVMRALADVPRHEFVSADVRRSAYENRPLPIGHGQTISQPYIVAIMTDLLEPEPDHRVLEIGTGSGYQAAILSPLVSQVYSIEIIPELGELARDRLTRLGYDNVTVRIGDGYHGWEEHAPFDGIVVTAAGDHVPPALVEQLKPGGRIVIPVGGWYFTQQLLVIHKQANGEIETREILPVVFVPLTGDH